MKPLNYSTARLSRPLATALVAMLATHSVHAGTTWDGGAGTGNTNIDNAINWNDNVVNALNGTTTATFGTGGSTATINVDASFTSITLNRAANFTIANGAGSLTVGTGGITVSLPSTATRSHIISESNLILNGSQTWVANNNTGTATLTVSSVISEAIVASNLSKAGSGTVVLSGANTYTGTTTIGTPGSIVSGGTLTVSGTAGTISASTGYTVNGFGSQLNLDYVGVTAGGVDRIANIPVVLNLGGELRMSGTTTAATNSTESIGTLTFGTGAGIVSINHPGSGGSSTTLTAAGLSRGSNFSTALIRGTNLGFSTFTNSARLALTDSSGLTQIGTSTSSAGNDSDTVKNLTIIPYLIGASSATSVGTNFVTLDSTSGLRRLGHTEQSLLSAAVTGDNVRAEEGANFVTGAQVFNSLLLSSGGTGPTPGNVPSFVTGDGNSLTLTSGALANVATSSNGSAIMEGFSSIIFGTTGANEAIITNTNTALLGTLTIDSPIDTFSPGGGLTKSGAGTVILTASNLYTGKTIVNQGVLQIGNGISGDLGTNTADIEVNGGTVAFVSTDLGLNIGRTITGAGGLSLNAANGLITLSGTSIYSGLTTVIAGTVKLGSAAGVGIGPLSVTGTSVFDLNGFSASVADVLGGSAGNSITNSGSSDSTLTIENSTATISSLITDGPTNKVTVMMRNNNFGAISFGPDNFNTFSGGLTLLDGSSLNPAGGTRLRLNVAVSGSPFGTGPITIGQTATDKAGILFDGSDNTMANPLVINTSRGTDRFGIRNDARTITLSGLITVNADMVFSSNNATLANTIITNQVTGTAGLAIDLSQTSAANTRLTVTLRNTTPTANDYAGDTVVGRANGASTLAYTATLALGADEQIPHGPGKGSVTINSTSGTQTGTLNLGGFNETINGLNGNGRLEGGTSGTPLITLGDGNANGNFSGIIQNTGSTLSLTKIGSGTQILSGANTYTGTTTVNGGTLALGANNVIPDVSAITIGTGMLDAATFTDTMGTLDVSATSAKINLGSGGALVFADSSAVDWTGGGLDITGTFVSGASIKFGASASALTPTQLGLITVNGAGAGTYALNSSGFLVSASSAYETWKAANAPGSNPQDDTDGDGVPNAVEFVLGGTSLTKDIDKLPVLSTSGANMTFTFQRAVSSIDPKTAVFIETSTDLVTWNTVPSPYTVPDSAVANVPGVTVVEDTAVGFDTVTLTVPQAPDNKKFARLRVVITP